MIVEDENGNQWDLADLRDQEREPEPLEQEPLSLEEIEAALDACYAGGASAEGEEAADLLIREAVPQMLAELRAVRERLARYEQVPTQEEWTVTADAAMPPGAYDARYTADAAMKAADRYGKQAWRRVVTHGPVVVQPWEPNPFSAERPF
ncbi:hypothetical protein ACGF0J_21890 [Nonomuraea sp. NPDC047897]|uniref:hypothetical protein n=1 Tax=Nonomuraea sp. NPDC047897 TaxID=3364346 RepID=UPI00371DEA8A